MTPDSSSGGDRPGEAAADAYFTFSRALVALEAPPTTHPAVEIHQIAAQIIDQQVDRGRRGVAVCAPGRGMGATLVTVNLAIAVAQAGVSVLLVDGDLHEPGIEALITPSQPTLGLQQVLRSFDTAPSEAICHDVLPGLSILYAGGACADASELVGGSRCSDVLTDCLRNFTYVIVDTPPANRSVDSRRLAATIGYSLIVARRNCTYVDDLSTLASELAEDRSEVIGTLFNAA